MAVVLLRMVAMGSRGGGASVPLTARPLRPQAPVRAALACGVPAASSAGQPLARLGAVPGAQRVQGAPERSMRQGGPRGACGPTSARGDAVVGGKSRLIFLDTVRLLKRVWARAMARCPCGQRGALRIRAIIPQGEGHCQLNAENCTTVQ